jgi:hypothetical protein
MDQPEWMGLAIIQALGRSPAPPSRKRPPIPHRAYIYLAIEIPWAPRNINMLGKEAVSPL